MSQSEASYFEATFQASICIASYLITGVLTVLMFGQ